MRLVVVVEEGTQKKEESRQETWISQLEYAR